MSDLEQVLEMVRRQVKRKGATVCMSCRDESTRNVRIMGTRDGFLNFAHALVELVHEVEVVKGARDLGRGQDGDTEAESHSDKLKWDPEAGGYWWDNFTDSLMDLQTPGAPIIFGACVESGRVELLEFLNSDLRSNDDFRHSDLSEDLETGDPRRAPQQGRLSSRERIIVEDLESAIDLVRAHLGERSDKVAISCEWEKTNESFLHGTAEGYLNLALELLEFVVGVDLLELAVHEQTRDPSSGKEPQGEPRFDETMGAFFSTRVGESFFRLRTPGSPWIEGAYIFRDHAALVRALTADYATSEDTECWGVDGHPALAEPE